MGQITLERTIYGTKTTVKIEGEIIFETPNGFPEPQAGPRDDAYVLAHVRAGINPEVFDKLDLQIVDRVENTPLIITQKLLDCTNAIKKTMPDTLVGEKMTEERNDDA
jgi:hypothetical protein